MSRLTLGGAVPGLASDTPSHTELDALRLGPAAGPSNSGSHGPIGKCGRLRKNIRYSEV